MSISTRGTAPNIAKLTAALAGFLAVNGLPDPACVGLTVSTCSVDIQPQVRAFADPVAVLGSLLLWARGLTAASATWRRFSDPEGDRVHISIRGRLASGVRINVYTSLPFDPIREWVCLDRDQTESVSLDELAWLLGELHTARPAA